MKLPLPRDRDLASDVHPTRVADRATLRVRDPGQLAAELSRIIREDKRFGGVHARAAKAIRIGRSQLYRYATGRVSLAELDTARHLSNLLPVGEREAFIARHFAAPDEAVALELYPAWLLSQLEAIYRPAGLTVLRDALSVEAQPSSLSAPVAQRTAEFARIIERLDRIPAVTPERIFFALLEAVPLKSRTTEAVTFHGEAAAVILRIRLAWLRIVAPLLQGVESGGTEPDWRDLDDFELVRFINAGVRRESMFLRRLRPEVASRFADFGGDRLPELLGALEAPVDPAAAADRTIALTWKQLGQLASTLRKMEVAPPAHELIVRRKKWARKRTT